METEVATAVSGMRKGPPSPDHLNLSGLDVAHLTHLINSWWNNEPMGVSTTAVTLIQKTKPIAPKPEPVPYSEPILTAPKMLALHPRTTNQEGFRWFKKQQACLWTAEEIDTAKDIDDFNKLSDPEQSFIKTILAFFASADSIVMDN